MHCKHCGFANGEDDHRCLRCGRRIGVAVAAQHGYSGANALALVPELGNDTQELLSNTANSVAAQPLAVSTATTPRPQQVPLFNAAPVFAPHAKIIPFDQEERARAARGNASSVPPQRPAAKRTSAPVSEQTTIDFIPAAPPKPRASKDHVENVIFCEQPVALPMHRFVAASIDATLILLACGLFVTTYLGLGGSFGEGKMFWAVMAGCFLVLSMFYGSMWGIMGRETLGMQSVGLELITFDGFPVEGRARVLRYFATTLSFCSAALGLLWSLVDEEMLTWQDHISKTFPTVRETPRNFVRR